MNHNTLQQYLDQLEAAEEQFMRNRALDSSQWNLADAVESSQFYRSHLQYTKEVLQRAMSDMLESELALEVAKSELQVVLTTIDKWKSQISFIKKGAEK